MNVEINWREHDQGLVFLLQDDAFGLSGTTAKLGMESIELCFFDASFPGR
jgi:hypothetical protein